MPDGPLIRLATPRRKNGCFSRFAVDNGRKWATLRAVAMTLAAPSLEPPFRSAPLAVLGPAGTRLPFFGDDWDDVLDVMPTVRRPRTERRAAPPATDKRPSGVWHRRSAQPALTVPLVVRWVDPNDILDVMRADPWAVAEPRGCSDTPSPTYDVLPWEIEVIEDTLELRESLRPPSLLGPLPVLPITTPRRGVSPAWWLVPAAVVGFVFSAGAWAAGTWLAAAL